MSSVSFCVLRWRGRWFWTRVRVEVGLRRDQGQRFVCGGSGALVKMSLFGDMSIVVRREEE